MQSLMIRTRVFAAVSSIVLFAMLGKAGELPKGWHSAGSHPSAYIMVLDTSVRRGGKAGARIESTENAPGDGFGTMMQTFKADKFHGERIRLSAWMKTENASSAQIWLRLDGTNSLLGFDNMDSRAVKGTTDWTRYAIVLDVPETTVNIAFGFFVVSKGKAWADDFNFEIVGKEIQSTNMLTEERPGPASDTVRTKPASSDGPLNLDFEN